MQAAKDRIGEDRKRFSTAMAQIWTCLVENGQRRTWTPGPSAICGRPSERLDVILAHGRGGFSQRLNRRFDWSRRHLWQTAQTPADDPGPQGEELIQDRQL
jgi:hypothetical protein